MNVAVSITKGQLVRLNELLQSGQEHSFYTWSTWRRKINEVKKLDNNECQMCKARGRYSSGKIVHHIKHLKDRPDLALDIYDPASGS